MDLTPVHSFGGWCAKREDLAAFTSDTNPSGSKVRQYARMAAAAPGVPMLVGCSAHSAMQIYVAAAAKTAGVPAHIYVPERKQRTDATLYAIAQGAYIHEVRPGYLSVVRTRAREGAKELGRVVKWDVDGALRDAYDQCANLPDVRRVVVATGSGLTAAGVLAGCAGRVSHVLAVCVSPMADAATIRLNAAKLTPKTLPIFGLMPVKERYEQPVAAVLPDGTPLDPFYAAKVMPYIEQDDCFWIPGLRPLAAFPKSVRTKLDLLRA